MSPNPALSSSSARWRAVAVEAMAWGRAILSAAVYATLLVTFVFQIARVDGRSMQPALEDQDRLIVDKLSYVIGAPEPGDIVMLRRPDQPDTLLVKRVVAAPGDTVSFRDGRLFRNGAPVREAFVPADEQSTDTLPEVIVPDGYYYVLGDHRNDSADSRMFGAVPRMYILGKVRLRWWPLPDARLFRP